MKDRRGLFVLTGAFKLGGGIAAVNRLVLKALTDEGYTADLYSLCESDTAIDGRYVDSSLVEARAFDNHKVPFTFAVWYALLTHKYDLIMVDLINSASILALPGFFGLCRYVVWLYGTELFLPLPDFEGRLGMLGAYKRIAISSFTRETARQSFPTLPVDTCELALDPIRHPFDPSYDPENDHHDLTMEAVDGTQQPLGEQIVLTVGRIWRESTYKGQPVLIRAMADIIKDFPRAQLVIAGSGDGMIEMMALAQSQVVEVRRAIFMPGFVSDELLLQLYQWCTVFAMPSSGEGFGLVYLEAMQWAKPCIGSRKDAAGTLIEDDITGLLINDPESSDELSTAIKVLLGDPDKARRLGAEGRRRVESKYLFPHFKTRLLAALDIELG